MNHLLSSLFILVVLLLQACTSYNNVEKIPSVSGDIQDNASWYEDMQDDVIELRVSVPIPNEFECAPYDNTTAPIRPCTLDDVYWDIDPYDDYNPSLHVKMEFDDFISPDENVNAVFKQKGKTTRKAEQKSYRVKLDSKTDLYRDERTFQLNEHPYDKSRLRNKLTFDLFKDIPNITSLKTQFINLRIDKDDYGLFTHVEKVGKEFLLNRGWNEDDNLYKAQYFTFQLEDDLKLNDNGTPLDQDAFDAIIEVERGKKQTKLIEMLSSLDKEELSDEEFTTLFKKYFNRANYLTWMATNIVTGNKDTITQNFFLYNPLHSDTFYFLPWDYDGAGREINRYAKWQLGVGNWWDISLHKAFLKIKKNREELDTMVDLIRDKYITPKIMEERISIYKNLIKKYIENLPDSENLRLTTWEQEVEILPLRLDENLLNYKNEIGVPMPFWLSIDYKNDILTIAWDKVIDFENDPLVYDIKVADNYDLNSSLVNVINIKHTDSDLTHTSYSTTYTTKIDLISNQKYYLQVIAKEESNFEHYQIAFDNGVRADDGSKRSGLLEFIVE